MKQMIHGLLLDTDGNPEMPKFAPQNQKQPQGWPSEESTPLMPHNQQVPRLATASHLPMPHAMQDQQRPAQPQFLDQRTGAPSGNATNYTNPAGQNPNFARPGGQNPFTNHSDSHAHYKNPASATASYSQPSSNNTKPSNPPGSNPSHANPSSTYPMNSLMANPNGIGHGSPFAALSTPLPLPLQDQPQRQQQQQQPVNRPLPWLSQQQAVPQQPVKQPSRPPSAGSFMGMLTDGDTAASPNTAANNRLPNPFQARASSLPLG